jgi:hypothetical protein
MNKYFPAVVCGFAAAVLTTVPGIRNFGCCLLVPAAAIFSIVIHKKISKSSSAIEAGEAILFGLFTGLAAAFFASGFDLLLTYISHSNDFVENLSQVEGMWKGLSSNEIVKQAFALMDKMASNIKVRGFSLYYTMLIFFSNGIMFSIFGMIGGILGRIIVRKQNRI